ncbi:hypothetical protein ACFX15_012409 [Malus domestica]
MSQVQHMVQSLSLISCISLAQSKAVVPSGTYMLIKASFKGPCKASIEIQVQGKLTAPTNGNKLIRLDTQVSFEHFNKLIVSGGGTFDGQGALSWKKNDCNKNKDCKSIAINMRFNFVTNSTIQDITSLDNKNFHINILRCHNVTFQHFNVMAPRESINTDGIYIGRSTGINITDAHIGTRDDCVSIGDGNKEITITRVTCGPSHGISVGSLGSSGIPCEKVELADINLTYNGNKGPLTSQGSNVKPTITRVPNALACATSS